jgi:uncharacterized cupin superfamily protein
VPDEAKLVESGAGLVPQDDGWFVVNVRDAAWIRHDGFGARTNFEAHGRIALANPELHQQSFPDVGVTLFVFEPGKPSTMYHGESESEAFLVLQGEVLAIIEGQERLLKPWDFFYAAPHTMHSFVGAGDGPAVMLMLGARDPGGSVLYPRDETALKHGAGVEQDTPEPQEAYARFGHWRLGRPVAWDDLPWNTSKRR